MSKSPAFQLYTDKWLSSLNILLMTPAEEGAYIRLLCYCWESGDCSLPDNDDLLAQISRLNEGWFKGSSTKLRKCFKPHPTKVGYITNERLLFEMEKQKKWREKSIEGGKKSAEIRKLKSEKSNLKDKKSSKIAVSKEPKDKLKGGSRVVEPKANRPVEPKGNITSSFASSSSFTSSKKNNNKKKVVTQKENKTQENEIEDLTGPVCVDHFNGQLFEKEEWDEILKTSISHDLNLN